MEIDITDFFSTLVESPPILYSGSDAEYGGGAAAATWSNAMDRASPEARDESGIEPVNMLKTPDQVEAFKEHMQGMGFSEAGEMDAWTHQQMEALFIQLICGDVREAGIDPAEPDWEAYEAGDNAGGMFVGDNGRVYYYLGT